MRVTFKGGVVVVVEVSGLVGGWVDGGVWRMRHRMRVMRGQDRRDMGWGGCD